MSPSVTVSTPCSFYARGNCRAGDACKFVHDEILSTTTSTSSTIETSATTTTTEQDTVPSPTTVVNTNTKPSASASASAMDKKSTQCVFFSRGACKMGESCRFRHDDTLNAKESPPPPVIVSVPPYSPVYCIDVECVATGPQHHDRAVAQISLVDASCQPILNLLVQPDMAIKSYLTPLTGLNAELLAMHGIPLAQAIQILRAHLPPSSTLIGMGIAKDCEWLGLCEGVDYRALIDLSGLLRVWNTQHHSYSCYGLDHYAGVWLGASRQEGEAHNAVVDALKSMALFNGYVSVMSNVTELQRIGNLVISTPVQPSFAVRHSVWEGCCMGRRQTCVCGAPFFS